MGAVNGQDFMFQYYRVTTDQDYVTLTAYLNGGIEVSAKTRKMDIDFYDISSVTSVTDELLRRLSFVVSLINQSAGEVPS